MNIHEYQSLELLREYGVPVPVGKLACTPQEARQAASEIGGDDFVLKAQVHAGGRGKAGGIKFAKNADEAADLAGKMLGTRLVNNQTGSEGKPINKLLVRAGSKIKKEFYLGFMLDPAIRGICFVASPAGGMDIEKVAEETPEKILRLAIDPQMGMRPFIANEAAVFLGIPEHMQELASICSALYRLVVEKDCTLVEINPLAIVEPDKLLPIDVKINFDENALFRHPEIAALRDPSQDNPLEVEAHNHDVNYISLDGDIGCLVNGAGLAMAMMDAIHEQGGAPANFLDVGGGALSEKVEKALGIIMADPKVKGIIVNIFAGITSCEAVAKGLVEASKTIGIKVPLVVRMEGNQWEEGYKLLADAGIKAEYADSIDDAARKMVALLAKGA